MFDLAVCAEMVFLELPVTERVRRIADLGFQVEIWDWTGKDVDALVRTGAVFSSMTGYVTGTLTDPTAPASCWPRPSGRSRPPSGSAAPASTSTAPGWTPAGCRCGRSTRSPGPCDWPPPAPWTGWPSWGSGPG
jgi:hypothetical protein